MSFQSIQDILKECETQNKSFATIVIEADMRERDVSKEESRKAMHEIYEAMVKANADYNATLHSHSGLVGGAGAKMEKAVKENTVLSGPLMGEVIAKALKMGESNACMKRIVAAPTAGSCGVVPAVLLTVQEQLDLPIDAMIDALYVIAGVGEVIANRAFLSGAAGGCQAEIGSASAMAAAGLTFLRGGSNEAIAHAVAMSLKNLLGLACDPVAGLVEVPCVKRNVVGAVNALAAADMTIAGITSAIPADEVIDAMRTIGLSMPVAIRETSEGGLATTPTGIKIAEKLDPFI